MRAWLVGLPQSVQRLMAWLVVLIGPMLVLVLAVSIGWNGWQQHQRVAGLRSEYAALATRIEAQLAELSERGASLSRDRDVAISQASVREQFEADYAVFLDALEAAGIDIAQATGVGEVEIGGGISELNAAWAGTASLQALLPVLASPELNRATISEFSVRATPNEGTVDVFIEFRSAFIQEEQG